MFNREGSAQSPLFRIMNSGRPLTPTVPVVLLESTETTIKVRIPLVAANFEIISYELQIDDGLLGNYRSLGGFDSITMQTEYTVKNLSIGRSYRLRYRVMNYVGWSGFSPTLFALVAVVPSAPAKPELVAATSSTITLQLYQSLNSGGS